MSLTKENAELLFGLGFKRQSYAEKTYPTDIFEHKGDTWCVGGRIVPNTNLCCDEEIYNNGTWIPSLEDLLLWLRDNECIFTLSYNGNGFKIEIVDNEKRNYKAKGGTAEFAIFNGIVKILKNYGGNPINKKFEIIEAELIINDENN